MKREAELHDEIIIKSGWCPPAGLPFLWPTHFVLETVKTGPPEWLFLQGAGRLLTMGFTRLARFYCLPRGIFATSWASATRNPHAIPHPPGQLCCVPHSIVFGFPSEPSEPSGVGIRFAPVQGVVANGTPLHAPLRPSFSAPLLKLPPNSPHF